MLVPTPKGRKAERVAGLLTRKMETRPEPRRGGSGKETALRMNMTGATIHSRSHSVQPLR